jgi:hypothetical protein
MTIRIQNHGSQVASFPVIKILYNRAIDIWSPGKLRRETHD